MGMSDTFGRRCWQDFALRRRRNLATRAQSEVESLVGTGYESFWLGPRLQRIWLAGWRGLNAAHNGYLEVF